jgi:hypothetical protein
MEIGETDETDGRDSLATSANTNWTCLIDPLGTGAAGGEGAGAELLTQHELSQAQRAQHEGCVV